MLQRVSPMGLPAGSLLAPFWPARAARLDDLRNPLAFHKSLPPNHGPGTSVFAPVIYSPIPLTYVGHSHLYEFCV